MRAALAHRVSWVLTNGPIPDGAQVLHRCDTPACINPAHLFLGDHQANMRDKATKGRTNSTKLDANDIPIIRQMIDAGWTQRQTGKLFDVTQSAIYLIMSGKRWAHIPAEVAHA
jgi:hypothetical protein